jgi:hypothetical protein
MWSGNIPGGLQPRLAGKKDEPAVVIWEHDRALEIRTKLLDAALKTNLVWRGEMLCCQSVETRTLPIDLVNKVFQDMKIEDHQVKERGLSLFFPGGGQEFNAGPMSLPFLVLGETKTHLDSDPYRPGSANSGAANHGLQGCPPCLY